MSNPQEEGNDSTQFICQHMRNLCLDCTQDLGGPSSNPDMKVPVVVPDTSIKVESRRPSQGGILPYIVSCLATKGHAVVDGFLGDPLGTLVLDEVTQMDSKGILKEGKVVAETQKLLSSSKQVRGDRVVFVGGNYNSCDYVDPETGDERRCNNVRKFVVLTDVLVAKVLVNLNQLEFKQLSRTGAMVACYPGEGRNYRKHIDNPSKDGRLLTTIYYLNKGWTDADGGQLQLYPESELSVNIEPLFDRLVLFWSDHRTPHQVLPANSCRYAITIWYHDIAELRQYAKEQQEANLRAAAVEESSAPTKSQRKRRKQATSEDEYSKK